MISNQTLRSFTRWMDLAQHGAQTGRLHGGTSLGPIYQKRLTAGVVLFSSVKETCFHHQKLGMRPSGPHVEQERQGQQTFQAISISTMLPTAPSFPCKPLAFLTCPVYVHLELFDSPSYTTRSLSILSCLHEYIMSGGCVSCLTPK